MNPKFNDIFKTIFCKTLLNIAKFNILNLSNVLTLSYKNPNLSVYFDLKIYFELSESELLRVYSYYIYLKVHRYRWPGPFPTETTVTLSISKFIDIGSTENLSYYIYLKVHRYRWSGPFLLVIGVQQFYLGTKLTFLHTAHTLDSEISFKRIYDGPRNSCHIPQHTYQ